MSATEINRQLGRHPLVVGGFGVLLGFVVSAIGFTDYRELMKMFLFVDLRMFLAFIGGVVVSFVGYQLMKKARPLPQRRFHRGVAVGGVLFGAGWALCGACPGVAFAQLGQGKLWALVTLAGIAAGTVAYRQVNRRVLNIPRDSCG